MVKSKTCGNLGSHLYDMVTFDFGPFLLFVFEIVNEMFELFNSIEHLHMMKSSVLLKNAVYNNGF